MSLTTATCHILLAEPDPEVRSFLETALRCQGYTVVIADTALEIMIRVRSSEQPFSMLLLDSATPGCNGEFVTAFRELDPRVSLIVMCGPGYPPGTGLIERGANACIVRPADRAELWNLLTPLFQKALSPSVAHISLESPHAPMWCGDSPAMRRLRTLIAQVGPAETPLLIQGETGSGKEMFAREVHALSRRSRRPLHKLNCAALPSELVESELFGYERGAFTGAFQKKPGMFDVADHGTMLLDEIGDMDFGLQAKLLQVLQDQTFQRLGGKELVKVDVRILAATHRNLERAIECNQFRQDLYYRLSVIKIRIPPLRERPEDICPLAEFLLRKHAEPYMDIPELPSSLRNLFLEYSWPGNVRELENVVRNFLVLRDADLISAELRAAMKAHPHMTKPMRIAEHAEHNPLQVPAEDDTFSLHNSVEAPLHRAARAKQEAEIAAIVAALEASKWNRRQAAVLLEIDYKALLYKMKRLGIRREDYRKPAEALRVVGR
jgi:two-component system response regulator AtoC